MKKFKSALLVTLIVLSASLVRARAAVSGHDVGIINVVSDLSWVYEGRSTNVGVTVINNGTSTETSVNVTLYYNFTASKMIGTPQIISLDPGKNQTLTFTWDTTGVLHNQTYTLTAVASIPSPDDSPGDNTFIDGNVTVRIMGDVNGDGIVNMADIDLLLNAFLSYQGHPLYNPDLDLCPIVPDGEINLLDIFVAVQHYLVP